MIVISDNSPLSALAEAGLIDLLPKLYHEVVIPAAVALEASHASCPPALLRLLAAPPPWLRIVPDPLILPETMSLDPGESAAISLAWTSRPTVQLIVDDLPARKICESLGLSFTGTAGVVFAAAKRGWCDFKEGIRRLQATRFRITNAVIEELRKKF